MAVAGTLNDLTQSLGISVARGGQLIAAGSAVVCFGAPLLALLVGGWDRRRLLVLSLLWYAAGHLLCLLAPDYATLLPLRVLSMVSAAVFTLQAAAAIGTLAPLAERGRSITFVFLGWSVASVFGMPMHSAIAGTLGWRAAFGLVALLALGSAGWLWRVMPAGVRPPAMSLRHWRQVLTQPVLMALILVTALQSAGQSTLYVYLAPYLKQVLHARVGVISGLFFWYGAFGLLGNLLVSRRIDGIGPCPAVTITLSCVIGSLLLWPLATSLPLLLLVLVPWALGGFAVNSAQQARLQQAAPAAAPALMALRPRRSTSGRPPVRPGAA
jgi:predicted MFS family arabinose efflux permease